MREVIDVKKYDLICVGGGIMSMTLALMTKILVPEKEIIILEKLNELGLESSGAWNNAGTGHSAFCELNYTPERNGKIDTGKALKVCEQFEYSRQFWTYLAEKRYVNHFKNEIHAIPHYSWVTGEDDVHYLKKRYEAMKDNSLFQDMEYSEKNAVLRSWFPLIMAGRSNAEKVAATKMNDGLEVNYGELIKSYARILVDKYQVPIHFNHEVRDIDPNPDVDWTVKVRDTVKDHKIQLDADHVFIGAGGGALPLLQKVEIEEKEGYGGFPVSGQWLVCHNESMIQQHWAKVYGKAQIGSPPMSVPHLDTRVIDGKRQLLFGPFAGFSTKFLKDGSYLDLFRSVKFDNIPSMWGAFWHNLPLTKYLIEQVTMDHEERMTQLRDFIIHADSKDWKLIDAGQRVQIIKKSVAEGGELRFGTEVVNSPDGKISAVLGASPGASTAVYIMLEVLQKVFPESLGQPEVQEKLHQIFPIIRAMKNVDFKSILDARKRSCSAMGIESGI